MAPAAGLDRAQAGRLGEEVAARYLTRAGAVILHRNWRAGHLELDIVCALAGLLVFVEVKTRKTGGLLLPEEALGPLKRRRLALAARRYLAAMNEWTRPCRFDLVCVRHGARQWDVEHYPDVFSLSDAVGRGDPAWQPW